MLEDTTSVPNERPERRREREKGLSLLKLDGACDRVCATTRESTEDAEGKGEGKGKGKETGKTTFETVPSQADVFKSEGQLIGFGSRKGDIKLNVVVRYVERIADHALSSISSTSGILSCRSPSESLTKSAKYTPPRSSRRCFNRAWVSLSSYRTYRHWQQSFPGVA